MRVESIMTKDVSYCDAGTNAAAAAEIMWSNSCGSLPIVEDGNHVIGIVTDRDLFIALGTSNRRPAELPVGEIMNRDLSVCAPGDDIRSALRTMAERQLHRLPVVDRGGELRGMLSLDDIVVSPDRGGLSREDIVRAMKTISEHQVHPSAVKPRTHESAHWT
jgi:CBS domain-containing protein